MTMKTKEEYLADAKAQLDEWEGELAELRKKAAESSDDVREQVEQQMATLKTKWDEGAQRRQEILDAADDKWDDIKDEAEEKWDQVKHGAKEAIDRVKSYFS
jgi:DNA anti-recombination protein RmuC